MRFFFSLMLLLLTIRIAYYIVIKFIQPYFYNKQGVFNLWLILPYFTEIVLNIVIFYYNFLQDDKASQE